MKGLSELFELQPTGQGVRDEGEEASGSNPTGRSIPGLSRFVGEDPIRSQEPVPAEPLWQPLTSGTRPSSRAREWRAPRLKSQPAAHSDGAYAERGRNAETMQFGASTMSLMRRSAATLATT